MLNDYKYAIRTAKQVGDYNKTTNYLILHIRKSYENGGDITNMIENQEPFNFDSSAPKLKILTTVMGSDTTLITEKLEIMHENDQYRIKYEAELQLIENAQSDTFKAPCCCFENVPNTALTIVCTINVSIDCS